MFLKQYHLKSEKAAIYLEKIFIIIIFKKRIISRIHKELLQINKEKTIQYNQWVETYKLFPKEDIQIANKPMKRGSAS